MAKLKLELDALAVQSFATSPRSSDERGTVRGHNELEQQDDGFSEGTFCTAWWRCFTLSCICAGDEADGVAP